MAEIQGLDQLKRKLEQIEGGLSGALEAATRSGALLVQNDAKESAPYLTGNLRRSIHMETAEKSSDKVTIQVGTDVVYAAAQEFGMDGIPPHPYLRPALDHNKDKVLKEMKEALADVLKRVT